MEKIKLKHILIAALSPLLVIALGTSIYQSIVKNEIRLIGLVIGIYYFIPSLLFTFLYVTVLRGLINLGWKTLSVSLITQISLSLVLGLLLLTFWVVFDGSAYNYRGMNFSMYWTKELKRYWVPVICFGVPVSIILNLLTRNKKKDGQ